MTESGKYREDMKIRLYGLIILVYLSITLVMTYPLALHFTTHVPGMGADDQNFLWNLWWVKYSLVDLGTNPFYTDYMFHPNGVALIMHTHVFLNGLISVPLQYFLGLITINNLFIVLSFVLSAFGAFLMTDYIVKDKRAAFIAGVIFSFCPFKFAHLGGHVNFTMTQWMPFYIYFMLKGFSGEEAGYKKACVLAGIMLVLNFYTEYYYFISVVLITAIYVASILITGRIRVTEAVKRLAYVLGPSIPFVAPVIFIAVRDSWPLLEKNIIAMDVAGILSPGFQSTFLGWLGYGDRSVEQIGYFGFSVIGLSLAGLYKGPGRGRHLVFWTIVFLFFTMLSLGLLPSRTGVNIPVLTHLRAPARFNIVSMLCLSIMASFGARHLVRRKTVWLMVVPVILLEFTALPVPLHRSDVPSYYEPIARDDDARVVLEVPVYTRDGGGFVGEVDDRIQYYQTLHKKKILNGFAARIPLNEMLSYLNLPLIRSIIIAQNGARIEKDTYLIDIALAKDVVRLLNIDYIVVHKIYYFRSALKVIRQMVPSVKVFEDDSAVVLRTIIDRKAGEFIDAGTVQSIPYLQKGWINGQVSSNARYAWSTGGCSTILLNLDEGTGYEMKLRMTPYERLEDRRVKVYLNGRLLTTLDLDHGWKSYTVEIPGDAVNKGTDKLRLEYSDFKRIEGDFGGKWVEGQITEYITVGSEVGNIISDNVLDWEQDNNKFRGRPVAIALDLVTINRK